MRNKKGFTLIELIVTIAIMGILLIIALPQVSKIKEANKYKKYEVYKSSIERAAKLYTDSNSKDMFGYQNSGCVRIPYSILKKANLIKNFPDNEISCSVDEETYVDVNKANNEFLYKTSMICRKKGKVVYPENYTTTNKDICVNEEDISAPTITVNPDKIDVWTQSKNVEIKIIVSDNGVGLNKNITVKYQWVKKDAPLTTKWKSMDFANKKGVKKVSKNIPKVNLPQDSGEYYLYITPVSVMDAVANEVDKSSQKFGKYLFDNIAPTCKSWVENNLWTNSNVTIKLYCEDIGSGCEKAVYDVKPYSSGTTKTENLSQVIKDRAGNTTTCKKMVNVYIDKDAPTCTSSGGSTGWTNDSRTLKGTCSDAGSGCKEMTISGRTYDNNGHVSWLINWDGNWTNLSPGTIYDKAGNSSNCPANQTVKVDKTAPTKPDIDNPSKGRCRTSGFSLTVETEETLSGVKYWQYKFGGDEHYTTYANSAKTKFTTTQFKKKRNEKVYIRACDNAGNCSPAKSTKIHIASSCSTTATDKTPINKTITNCHIRGNKKRDTGYYWKCDKGHNRNTHYKTYNSDATGKLTECKTFACTYSPYDGDDGWYVVDDDASNFKLDNYEIIDKP